MNYDLIYYFSLSRSRNFMHQLQHWPKVSAPCGSGPQHCMESTLELWMFTLEPWRLTLEAFAERKKPRRHIRSDKVKMCRVHFCNWKIWKLFSQANYCKTQKYRQNWNFLSRNFNIKVFLKNYITLLLLTDIARTLGHSDLIHFTRRLLFCIKLGNT